MLILKAMHYSILHYCMIHCCVVLHVSNMWNYLLNPDCPVGQPAILCGKNINVGHYMQTSHPQFFHTCHAYRHHGLLQFCITFTDLDLGRGPQDHCKAKTSWLHFLTKFLIDQDEIGYAVEIIQVGLPDTTSEGDKGNNCCFTDCVKKTVKIHLHLYVL